MLRTYGVNLESLEDPALRAIAANYPPWESVEDGGRGSLLTKHQIRSTPFG